MEKSSEGALQFGLSTPRMEKTRIFFIPGVSEVGECCFLGLLSPGEQEHPSMRVVSPALSDGRLCWLVWGVEVAVSHSSLDVYSEGSLALPLLGHGPGQLQLCHWHTEEMEEAVPSTCLGG